MRNRSSSIGLLTFIVILAVAIAGTVPAAAITINGTDYALFARCQIGMEDGPVNITGNIAVNEICGAQNGFLRVGAHNVVNGTATANRVFFGTASAVTTCEFNVVTSGNADAACGNIPPDPIPPGATLPITAWPPLPVPAVTPGAVDFICQAAQTCNLPAGAYRDIRARDDATINLVNGGVYEARNLFLENGSTLNGNDSSVNLTQTFNTEPNATINDVTITSIRVGTVEVLEVGNNSQVNNSVLYAPFARAHLHQATITSGTEVIAVLIAVEPITVEPLAPGGFCEKRGTKFSDLDQSHAREPGEPGLSGWEIRAYSQPGNVFVSSATTDGNGDYEFTGLACGTYTFCEVLQSGWTQTFPNVAGGDVVSCAAVDQSVTLGPLGYSETLVSGQPSVDNDFGNFTQLPPPPGGGEGCTPGFWKQSQHFNFWTAPYTPGTLFSTVFEDAFPGKTLLQVLQQGGGGLNALGRHTVAALLNAASSDVDYDLTVQQVIDMFNAVFPGTDAEYLALKDQLQALNQQHSPICN